MFWKTKKITILKLHVNVQKHSISIPLCVCVLKNMSYYYQQEGHAWGGGCTGLRVCVVCEEIRLGNWKGRGWSGDQLHRLLPPQAPQVYFWERLKDSWQATARPPIRLRNSWKSSCPSLFTSNFFIMWSRTPGSFWFFVKAASSLFMKVRNSVLESAELLLSFPAYLQKYHMYFPDTYTHTHF